MVSPAVEESGYDIMRPSSSSSSIVAHRLGKALTAVIVAGQRLQPALEMALELERFALRPRKIGRNLQ